MANLDDLQTNLINATNAMTAMTTTVTNQIGAINTTVANKIDQLDTWKNTFEGSWKVDASTILNVGPTRTYKTIQSAWDYLKDKNLKGEVTIKVDDGTYNVTSINIEDIPYACYVTIEGNVTSPSSCVINFVPSADKLSHGIMFINVRGINFRGFKIVGGRDYNTNFTSRGILIERHSSVNIADNTVIIEGTWNGIECTRHSHLDAGRITITNVRCGIISAMHSTVSVQPIISTTAFNAIDSSGNTTQTIGLSTYDAGIIYCTASNITGFYYGIYAQTMSYVYGKGISVTDTFYGTYAFRSSVIIMSKYTNNIGLSITNSTIAVSAFDCSYANIENLVVTNATDVAVKCQSGALINLTNPNISNSKNGIYALKSSYVVLNTGAAAGITVTTGFKFSPALNTLSTDGSYIEGS